MNIGHQRLGQGDHRDEHADRHVENCHEQRDEVLPRVNPLPFDVEIQTQT